MQKYLFSFNATFNCSFRKIFLTIFVFSVLIGCQSVFNSLSAQHTIIVVVEDIIGRKGEISIENDVNIFPQPASEILHVQLDKEIELKGLELFDVKGSLLYTQNMSGNKFGIRVDALESQIYILRLRHTQGIITRKVSVLH